MLRARVQRAPQGTNQNQELVSCEVTRVQRMTLRNLEMESLKECGFKNEDEDERKKETAK